MENNLIKENKFTRICSMAAVGLAGLLFILLSIASIMQTCRIDPAVPASEKINFDNDLVLLNLAALSLTALAFVAMVRKNIKLSEVSTRFVVFVMLIVTTLVSLLWVNLVQSVASGETMQLLSTARDAAADNYRSFSSSYDYYGNYSYYLYYPTKLGYVLFAELLYRVFGTSSSDVLLQIPNVIALDFLYVGLVMSAKMIFDRKAVTNMTAIALTVCLQPMFMTTFTYNFIIGMSLAVWSVFFTVRYIKENKLKHAGFAALLIVLSVVIKSDCKIILAAICIALILHTIGSKRFLALAVAAVMVVCSLGAQALVIQIYSARSGVTLDKQITPTLSEYSGISDSSMAPGWYNDRAVKTLRDSGMDMDKANETAAQGINDRLKYLGDNHLLSDFISKKLFSQFNEPSFESVWISQVKSHNIPEGQQLSTIVVSVYTGGMSKILDNWFNYYTMLIYIGFAAGMIWLLVRKKANAVTALLPMAFMGCVIYQMLFEAKSQYILPYFVLLIPFAMYGLLESTHKLTALTQGMFRENKPAEA